MCIYVCGCVYIRERHRARSIFTTNKCEVCTENDFRQTYVITDEHTYILCICAISHPMCVYIYICVCVCIYVNVRVYVYAHVY